MKSNKENIYGLFGRLKLLIGNGLAHSRKYPILRLSKSLFGKSSKAKVLKEKYRLEKPLQSSGNPPVISQDKNPSMLSNSTPSEKHFLISKFANKKVAFATIAAITLTGLALRFGATVDAYAVEVNGKNIAIVTQKAEVENLVSDLKDEKTRSWKRKVEMKQTMTFKKVKARRYQLDNSVALKGILNKSLTFESVATGIKVDGKVAVIVKDKATAEDVLKQLKESYKPDGIQIENIAFQEKVEIAEVPSSLSNVLEEEKALQMLKEGKQAKKVHIVKEGDSLWSIARANDMRVKEILKMNPSLTEDLDLDQEINLVTLTPMVNVIVSGQRTIDQELPYKVVVETDKNMSRGKEKVKVPGEKGLKKATYKVVMKNGDVVSQQLLQEKIIKNAKDKVIVRGKKQMIASRGTRISSRSGGKLSWPLRGRITSGYGKRWGERHTGIDIDGTTGEPVGAAANGVVVGTGWSGGYGKMVLIKHSNGLTTRYAHLSSISVSSGDRVEQGEVIGRVGSTGRSTGSHLHFEVIKGGSIVNPMSYLK